MTKKPQKKKSSLISKRTIPITGNKELHNAPKSLKPLRARQLIRRFHVLLKYKSSILTRIRKLVKWSDEKDGNINDNYMTIINKKKQYGKIYQDEWDKTWNGLKINKTPQSVIDPDINDRISNDTTVEDMIRILGKIDSEIKKRGGLETYQTASTLGQDGKRGGDSSKILVKWIKELGNEINTDTALEIGCLSSKNEISTSKIFKSITRIDLHSQEPNIIEEQDFLKRPLPQIDEEKFDCISCSLVVNFVPSAEQRGEMLCRMCDFLNEPRYDKNSFLFFVIPLPCVENSRYCNLETMDLIFSKLGFEKMKYHQTHKLAYWLLKWKGSKFVDFKFTCHKKELRTGKDRNNFCIIIK